MVKIINIMLCIFYLNLKKESDEATFSLTAERAQRERWCLFSSQSLLDLLQSQPLQVTGKRFRKRRRPLGSTEQKDGKALEYAVEPPN